jgi:hypothetical protein
MRKTLAVVALFALAACAPKAEEAPAADTTAVAAPAVADTMAAPVDSAAAATDTTKM